MSSMTEHPFAMYTPQNDVESLDRYHHPAQAIYTSGPLDLSIPADAYGAPYNSASTTMGYESTLYAESNYMLDSRASPGMYGDDVDMRLPPSAMSSASVPSAASSNIGSPQSNPGQMSVMPEWHHQTLHVQPSIVGNDYVVGPEYSAYGAPGMEELAYDFGPTKGFVDPSMIHPEFNRPPISMSPYEAQFAHAHQPYPTSPSASSSSPQPNLMRGNSSSPFVHNGPFQPTYPSSPYGASMDAHAQPSGSNQFVAPTPGDYHSGDEIKEKQCCTWPDCGKVFKDLKAHMLTHQNERPEKCPIQTCEYHVKGFARKYDKNRHTLTHYKGTMVCGFCPGSGSPAEKSFNRADVFKRHLTAVHGVEQTPPNSRKKAAGGANAGKKLSAYAPDATGKCSTCSQTFSNAQDFYEHLDDCVLRIVQQEDPSEAVNAKRLAEVENDKEVHETLEKNNLPTETMSTEVYDEDMDLYDDEDADSSSKTSQSQSPSLKKKGNPANGVQKSRGMTHSRGGVTLATKKGRKNRRDYPSSWGFDKGQMTMKKRVMAVFDGPRRLAKDDMMLSTEHEVRIKLSDGNSYVTDLDVQTLKRAEGFLSGTDEEKGPWISDDPTADQLNEMQRILDVSNVI